MYKNILTIILLISLCSCKEETKDTTTENVVEVELSIAEKIANAHGYANWKNVKRIDFTFGGNEEDPNSGRSWVWYPKTNDITMTTAQDTISYNRASIDSISRRTDGAFINDKFWAVIPFQLVWDEGTTISDEMVKEAPISKQQLNSITITYGPEGGYTPGDAYDIFYDNEYIIKEWIYRKGNAPEPSLTTSFENYGDHNGIKIARDHKVMGSDRSILIRNVKVEIDN